MKNKQFVVLNNEGGYKQNHLCGLHKRVVAAVSAIAMLFTSATFLPNNTFNLVEEITASAEETEPQDTSVASVTIDGNTTYYDTIDNAWAAAVEGKTATVTLLADTVSVRSLWVEPSHDITFDGGSYTLSAGNAEYPETVFLVTGGKLTITGGRIKTALDLDGVSPPAVAINTGTLEIIGGFIEGAMNGLYVQGGTARLSGGIFSSERSSAIMGLSDNVGSFLLNHGTKNEPHYAYFDENGNPIANILNEKKLTGTVTVKECKHDVSVCEYQHIDDTTTHQMTCLACGYNGAVDCTYGNEYQHDNTSHWQTCEFCDGTNTEEHNIITVNKKEPTCTEDGNVAYWKCDDCDTCFSDEKVENEIELSDTVISAIEHSFNNYVSNGDATCLEDGTKTATCDNCDETDTITDEKSAKGHSFTKYVSNGDATCIKDGTKTAKCDRCDETDTITDEKSAKGHSFTKYVSDGNATCVKDGTKTAKCDRCNVTNTITDEKSAKGHIFTKYVSDGNATCVKDGTKTAKCDRCDETDTITDKATGHNLTHINRNEPTSTKKGNIEYWYCENCKKYFSDEACKTEIKLSDTEIPMVTTTVTTKSTTTTTKTTTTKVTTKSTTSTTKTTTKVTTVTTKATTNVTTKATTKATSITTTVTTTTTKNEIPGDINGDGKTTVSDIVIMQQYLIKAKKLTAKQWKLADMNSDGKVNIFDVIILKRKLLK